MVSCTFPEQVVRLVGYPKKLCFPRQSEGLIIPRDVMGVRRGCDGSDCGLCLRQEMA